MTPLEIFWFLVPTDPFQVCFLSLILVVAGWNILEVRRHANANYWEAAWGNHTENTEDDDLDAEHGSITDLSQAVSHKAERWAEIMPGILLVIGLLGTFVGIGIALNKAAGILNLAQSDDGAARAIKDMLPMLNGLGTKFKTSTWGILGFLAFKTWHSRYGTEEKRLSWCITKSREQLNQRRDAAQQVGDSRHRDLLEALKSVGRGMCQVMQNEISLNRQVLTQKLAESQNSSKIQGQLLAQIFQQGELHQVIKDNSFQVVESTQEMNRTVIDFIASNAQSTAKMSKASDKIAQAAGALDGAIQGFSTEVAVTLNALTDKLDHTLTGLTGKLDDTLSNMNTGFTSTMQSASDKLNDTIRASSEQSERTTAGIQVAVKTMSEGMEKSLRNMNEGFMASMLKGAADLSAATERSGAQLGQATGMIKDAVVGMSQDVVKTQQKLQDTMTKVGESMDKSELKQAKILANISLSTDTLNAASNSSRAAIKECMDDLSEKLSTISKSNVDMTNVVRRLGKSFDEFGNLLRAGIPGQEPSPDGRHSTGASA